jgi:diaminopimelate epimerase
VGSNPKVDYQRTLPYLHSLLVQHHFNGEIGLSVGDYDTVRAVCAAHFEQDARGHWFVRPQAESAEYEGASDGRKAEACGAG